MRCGRAGRGFSGRFWNRILVPGLSQASAPGSAEDRRQLCAGHVGGCDEQSDRARDHLAEPGDGSSAAGRGSGNGRTARLLAHLGSTRIRLPVEPAVPVGQYGCCWRKPGRPREQRRGPPWIGRTDQPLADDVLEERDCRRLETCCWKRRTPCSAFRIRVDGGCCRWPASRWRCHDFFVHGGGVQQRRHSCSSKVSK